MYNKSLNDLIYWTVYKELEPLLWQLNWKMVQYIFIADIESQWDTINTLEYNIIPFFCCEASVDQMNKESCEDEFSTKKVQKFL